MHENKIEAKAKDSGGQEKMSNRKQRNVGYKISIMMESNADPKEEKDDDKVLDRSKRR